jgi:hypothetical protein
MERLTLKLLQQENVILKNDYDSLLEKLEIQEHKIAECKKINDKLTKKHNSQNKMLLTKIDELEKRLERIEIKKLNERKAGRKAYSNKETIQMIYTLYLDGKSLQGIVDELKRSEIKTKSGKDWSKSSVRFILINDNNVSNCFVDEDTFNRTVKLLNYNKKK